MMDFPSKIPIVGMSPLHQHICDKYEEFCDKYEEFLDQVLGDDSFSEYIDEDPEELAWPTTKIWFLEEHGINISDDCKFVIISSEKDYLVYSKFLLEFG